MSDHPYSKDIAIRLRSHETEGVTSSDRYHLRNEAAAAIDWLCDELAKHSSEIATPTKALGDKLNELEAARYRWLRANHGVVSDPDGEHTYYLMARAETLDAAIDAAMEKP